MGKHYLGLGVLGTIIVIILIIGFSIVGSPISQRAIAYDSTRLQDFSSLNLGVTDYYRDNGKLPNTLSEISSKYGFTYSKEDPETKKPYVYRVLSEMTYQFCTDFSTDSLEVEKRRQATSGRRYPSTNAKTQHTKGFDCIDYEIPSSYLKKFQPTPYSFPSYPTSTPYLPSATPTLKTQPAQ